MPDSDPETQPANPDPGAPAASSAPEASPPPADPTTPAQAFAAAGGDGAEIPPSEEREIWAARTSWKHFYGQWAAWASVMILVILLGVWVRDQIEWFRTGGIFRLLGVLAVIVLGSGAVLWAKFAIQVYSVYYRLTTQRLFVSRGILSRTTDQTELIRVDDVRVTQRLVDRIVGCGTVEVISTDVSDAKLSLVGVAGPDKIAEHVRQQMRVLRKKSLFVENL